MIFYNPFFPPFPKYSNLNYNSSKENYKNSINETKSTEETNKTMSSNTLAPIKTQKDNCKKPHSFYNYLQNIDTLILIGLLYFLYNQENKNLPLMLCIFLLLFD